MAKPVATHEQKQKAGPERKAVTTQKAYRARQKVEPGLVVKKSLFGWLSGK